MLLKKLRNIKNFSLKKLENTENLKKQKNDKL